MKTGRQGPYYRRGRGFYGDFRGVGGGREALTSPGSRNATHDSNEAIELYVARRKFYRNRTEGIVETLTPVEVPTLAAFHDRYLEEKRDEIRVVSWERERGALAHVLEFFDGGGIRLNAITRGDGARYHAWRKRGATVSQRTRDMELGALSALLTSAAELEIIPMNPLAGRKRRRKREATQTPYLERDDVVALLDAAARLDREPSRHLPDRQVRLAVLCYTGMRRNEAMGLLVSDVDLDRNLIHVRPNLKTATSQRVVPLFSELRALLVPWIGDRREGLLLPSPSSQMYRDIRGLLTGALKEAGITTLGHGARPETQIHGGLAAEPGPLPP
ncbi:MAG: tyrosine-type recombinase/integrase, partial [Gemmatimonadetes bacterium]|nr:tyrosine-type recombinase/integrase [Gemmatimonadota bacterium]